MTTKEKAEEITNKHLNDWIAEFVEYNNLSKNDRNQIRFKLCSACDEMAEWEHKRLVEKACEWLRDNANDYLDWYDLEECRIDTDGLLYNFNKAMKGVRL